MKQIEPAPSKVLQEDVLKDALRNTRMSVRAVHCVETGVEAAAEF